VENILRNKFPTSIFNVILLLVLIPALAGCRNPGSSNSTVGVLSASTLDNSFPTNITSIANEQIAGYKQAEAAKNNNMKLEYTFEDDPHTDIQVLIRNLAQDKKQPVGAIIGATANDTTLQIAGLVNFFHVPMLIPTADGDALFPSNNLWAFRLSAPSSAYATYLFTSVLNQTNLGVLSTPSNANPGLSIAILYEQNTFGETAAVATAEAAMAQGISIADYENFPVENPSIEELTTLVNNVKTQNPALVYLIASVPATAEALVGSLSTSRISTLSTPSIILGQAGAFTSESFLNSAQANGIYILRQKLNTDNCPASLTSYYQAQSYGTAVLLNYAIGLTNQTLAADKKWYVRTSSADELVKFRETLRDNLKATNMNVPCFGNVAFDTTGQNKSLEFEILKQDNGNTSLVAAKDFINLVINTAEGIHVSP
jgi:ABC-type branched-subunit amino acid transport system substrate-binding protein